MAPHVGIGVDTAQIKEKALGDLLGILEGVRGKKTLILDQSLSGPIGLFAKFSVLQDYGVDKIHWLRDPPADYTQKNIIFLARCTPRNAQLISGQVKHYAKVPGHDFDYSAFFVPRRTLVCEKILEEEGVVGDITIGEYPLYFIPLEPDLLSLELEQSFQELYLHKDYSSVFYAAKALMDMQQKYGLFPRILGKGNCARKLVDALIRMRGEVTVDDSLNPFALTPSSTIENLIIIDREIDFVTPLLTQLTYEGLIDEICGIKNSKVELDASIVGNPQQNVNAGSSSTSATSPTSQPGNKRTVILDSSDKLYEDLRDTNFAIVGNLLNKVSRRLQADYEGRHQAKTVTEIKQFVSKLGGLQAEHQSLRIHTGLAEEIMNHTRSDLFNKSLEVQQNLAACGDPSSQHESIEELIYRGANIEQVLRLLCIESCVGNGLRPKDLEFFKREILQAYGYHHILTFDGLEKLNLLQSRNAVQIAPNAITSYSSLRKLLRLIVDEVNEHDPDDISYVYSGYAPLSVRLIQCIIQKQYLQMSAKGGKAPGAGTGAEASSGYLIGAGSTGWKGSEEALRHVKGKTIDEIQRGEDKAVRARMILNGQNEQKMAVVFFLGGCTYTEIAALRFIGKQQEGRRKILIATTSIINGNKMIQAALST
ncbi:Sec1-like protein [Kalaharituber pfeilii]|nr:Sec1-like protein [Kalaharituber pfeilii]